MEFINVAEIELTICLSWTFKTKKSSNWDVQNKLINKDLFIVAANVVALYPSINRNTHKNALTTTLILQSIFCEIDERFFVELIMLTLNSVIFPLKRELMAGMTSDRKTYANTNRRDGVVVRASASQSADLGFNPLVESYQKTLANGIHSFPAWRSAFRGGCGEQAEKFSCCVLRQENFEQAKSWVNKFYSVIKNKSKERKPKKSCGLFNVRNYCHSVR